MEPDTDIYQDANASSVGGQILITKGNAGLLVATVIGMASSMQEKRDRILNAFRLMELDAELYRSGRESLHLSFRELSPEIRFESERVPSAKSWLLLQSIKEDRRWSMPKRHGGSSGHCRMRDLRRHESRRNSVRDRQRCKSGNRE